MNHQLRLSDPIAEVFKYLTPLVVLLVGFGHYLADDKDWIISSVLLLGGFAYWIIYFLPMKSVILHDKYLIISNDFKKERIQISDIEDLKTSGWPNFITTIYLKRGTRFGNTIKFATRQNSSFTGINKEVKKFLSDFESQLEPEAMRNTSN